jgi:hypothetical protein
MTSITNAKKEETADGSAFSTALLPSPRKVLLSFYGISFLYAIPYGAISTLIPGFFIYGAHEGATDEQIDQASEVVEIEGVLIGVFWVALLFFVPVLLHGLGGPRNSFATMMFAWSAAVSMLVGAYILSQQEPNSGIKILGSIFAVLIGAFGGLGYTAAELYLDYCAEWMATIQTNAQHTRGGQGEGQAAGRRK